MRQMIVKKRVTAEEGAAESGHLGTCSTRWESSRGRRAVPFHAEPADLSDVRNVVAGRISVRGMAAFGITRVSFVLSLVRSGRSDSHTASRPFDDPRRNFDSLEL